MPMEYAEAKDYDFEDVCETGATGCEETCIWCVGQLWNISSGVRRGLCCNELHVVKLVIGESSIRWLETNSLLPSSRLQPHVRDILFQRCRMAHNTFFGTLPLSRAG